MPQLPGGHVDRIEFEVRTNPNTQVDEVERGQVDWMKNPPPPDRYNQVREKYEGTQFREEPTISVYYFWMNTQEPPFDDVRVRQAVNHAIDPEALERIYAGTLQPHPAGAALADARLPQVRALPARPAPGRRS